MTIMNMNNSHVSQILMCSNDPEKTVQFKQEAQGPYH